MRRQLTREVAGHDEMLIKHQIRIKDQHYSVRHLRRQHHSGVREHAHDVGVGAADGGQRLRRFDARPGRNAGIQQLRVETVLSDLHKHRLRLVNLDFRLE